MPVISTVFEDVADIIISEQAFERKLGHNFPNWDLKKS